MIPTRKEDEEWYKNTGVIEACVFCKVPTRMWHIKTNNPVCNKCKQIHKVSELINWRKKS